MRKDEILKALRNAATSMTLDELSKMTGIEMVQLRVDLYRLTEEGKIEKRQRGNVPAWTIKISSAPEHRFERLARR